MVKKENLERQSDENGAVWFLLFSTKNDVTLILFVSNVLLKNTLFYYFISGYLRIIINGMKIFYVIFCIIDVFGVQKLKHIYVLH